MSQRILVTGTAGFIGSLLTERLLDAGAEVVGIDNFDPFYDPREKRRNVAKALEHVNFELVEVDCADLDRLETALGARSFDVVVHLAAKAGVRPSIQDPMAYVRSNVDATQAMLELARRRGIGRFVFGSSSSVYGNNRKVPFAEGDPVDHPISPYAATKRACELICHTYHHLFGMAVIALRFFTVYGPRQRPDLAIRKFATRMLRNEPIPVFGDGSTERDYTWVDDILDGVVAAIARTQTHSGEFQVINLGGSRTTSLSRLIELVADAVGTEPLIERLPMQPGDVLRTYADVTKARDLLGYEPSTTIESGIPRFVDWLERQESREPPPTEVVTEQP
jgi:UDP-glucuronate 4-epimerase